MNFLHLFIMSNILLVVTPVLSMQLFSNPGDTTVCWTPLEEEGKCVSLKYCPQVVNLFLKIATNTAKQYSLELRRACHNRVTADLYPVVCCTRPTVIEMSKSDQTNNLDVKQNSTTKTKMCESPTHEKGYCAPLESCAAFNNRIKNKYFVNEEFVEYLRASLKICESQPKHICCPENQINDNKDKNKTVVPNMEDNKIKHAIPTEEEGCGLVTQNMPRIVGGVDSTIGAWPWIVLIGYNTSSSDPFKCGGTLVSTKHVITAAHCILKELSFVRLGEFDLSTESDVNHVDVNVENIITHPAYRRDGRNDIAILVLEKPVITNELICPICLPTSKQMLEKSYVGSVPYAAGWGQTKYQGKSSTVLQEVQIPILENSVCQTSFHGKGVKLSEQHFDDSVVCAGVLTGGKDTCKGDSGGPLMIAESFEGVAHYYLLGVVSHGIECAVKGTPAIYTSTRHFMDWIKEQIAKM